MTKNADDLFQLIQRIEIESSHLATDILAGAYKSAFKGQGMEFEEVREYQSGDEIRHIDWNVTARMERPFVKIFNEERNITVLLVVDVSKSMAFGSQQTKSRVVAEIAALLTFSAIKNNDKVGLILFSNKVEKYLPPRKGARHVLRIIRELLAFQPQEKGTDVSMALSFLAKVHPRSSICFLISDFVASDFSHEASLVVQRHDLISILISDPHEKNFPKMGLVRLSDLETDQTAWIDSDLQSTHEEFNKANVKHRSKIKKTMEKMGAGFIEIQVDKPIVPELRKFFKLRKAK